MTTGLLITTAGQAAIAADLAGGADLVLSHVAFGDAGGVPYLPNEAQVGLVNERYRATIASVAVVAGAIVVDAVIPADTPDGSARPSHGFNVAEAGIYSAAGTLIGVAQMSNGYKPPPSTGQASIATFRFKLAVANPSAITVVIDPQAQIAVGRQVRPFFMVVDGVLNAPPGAPATGATYVIGAAPTGAWAGFANRLAQWIGVWALSTVPTGHLVVDNSLGEGAAGRYLRRTAGGWVSAFASEVAAGVTRLATAAETNARTAADLSINPANLGALLGSLFRRATRFTTSGTFDPAALGLTTADRILALCWAAGGGGSSVQESAGAGGGGGEFAMGVYNAPSSPIAVTVGLGGIGNNVGGPGGNGGASSVGSLISAGGGLGGTGGPGVGGSGGAGGLVHLPGGYGSDIYGTNTNALGGAAPFMGPGLLAGSNPYGAGGAAENSTPTAFNGMSGLVLIFY